MIIDTNVWFGVWPFQSFFQDSPEKLCAHVRGMGISTAMVSSIEAVLYPDPDVFNKLLLKKIGGYPDLTPVLVINPLLADAMARLQEYTEFKTLKAVKILPNYHNYKLLNGNFHVFMEILEANNILLMIQIRIEDERGQYPLMQIPPVDAKDIIRLASKYPKNKIVCLCASGLEAENILQATENVYADISYIDGAKSIGNIIQKVSPGRIVFGSHTPFFVTESARMKVMNEEVSGKDIRKICSANISKLLGDKHE